MYKISVDPRKVAPWHHENTTEELVNLARNNTIERLGVIPVYKVPEEDKEIGDYVLADGHTRRAAACIAGRNLVITVMENNEDYKELMPIVVGMDSNERFNQRKGNIINYAKAYKENGYFPKILKKAPGLS